MTSYAITYVPSAAKALRKLDRPTAHRLLKAIDDVAGYMQITLEESNEDPTAVPRALGVIARAGKGVTPLTRRDARRVNGRAPRLFTAF